MKANQVIVSDQCYHCGQTCDSEEYFREDKHFCCAGCASVYDILSENSLCEYYNLNEFAGNTQNKSRDKSKFLYLDLPEIKQKLIDFTDGKITKISFYIPAIHCSSCIWLLENLHRLENAVISSRTDFLKKQLVVTYQDESLALSDLVALLATLGYEPHITLQDTEERKSKAYDKESYQLIVRIAVAGFCFGNVMLISFPDYFGFDSLSEHSFRYVFNGVNILFSIPALFYSGAGYLKSAYKSLRKGIINIDFPLALGMWVLWLRSLFEIISQTGPGYIDTLTGLVFFLLVGKWFQQFTYRNLDYDRDFRSYFPIAVIVKSAEGEHPVPIQDLKNGDRILIRNQELIPADSVLICGDGHIDYSFVTGEGAPVPKVLGEIIYAGGKQVGDMIELEVVKTVSQSYLTELWNHPSFHKEKELPNTFQTMISRYFTIALLAVAFGSALYWLLADGDYIRAINAFSAVLIIACPCALALSSPFALGTALRILSNVGFYSKNTQTIEEITKTEQIVFDKTGTITKNNQSELEFIPASPGIEPDVFEKSCIKALVKNSIHPLSMAIYATLKDLSTLSLKVDDFREVSGKGIQGNIYGYQILIGSRGFVGLEETEAEEKENQTRVHVRINEAYLGYFKFQNKYREGIAQMIKTLSLKGYVLHLLSGDNEGEKGKLKEIFPINSQLYFRQKPEAKLKFIEKKQRDGKKVMMLGDGLNDAGALQQSNVGIAVSEDTGYFTPASDVIMDAQSLSKLPGIIAFCQKTMLVIKISFLISLIYNLIGLSFAVQGTLSPLIAAILMPLSSVTVILFTTFSVNGFKYLLQNYKPN